MQPTDWRQERSQDAVRRRPLRFLASPWRDREFLHARYERLLDALADRSRFRVVPLRELNAAPADRIVVGLRHDVDDRLASALDLARLEHARGLRATYFVLHTAPYYARVAHGRVRRSAALIAGLRELRELGHEIGWHNDLVTLQCVYGIDPVQYLTDELEWLRSNGIDVVGCAAHGSYWCHALGFHNNYFFGDLDEVKPGFPSRDAVEVHGRRIRLAKGRLADFGFEYDASTLANDRYFSDGLFGSDGRRWHPDSIDFGGLRPGDRVIVSIHPNYWDRSVAAKARHTLARGANRLVTGKRA